MNNQRNFLFVGNGPYLNRGCEAIVRGTVQILRAAFGRSSFTNVNFDFFKPAHYPTEQDNAISHKPIILMKRHSPGWFLDQLLRRTFPALSQDLNFGSLRNPLKMCDAVLSVGGDNYTLDYGLPRVYLDLNRYVIRHQKPLIIWGASLGPFDHRPELADAIHAHLRDDITAIFVRERRSQSYLEKYGIHKNVYLMADPAFIMESKAVSNETLGFTLPQGAIGLNLSPLVGKRVGGDNPHAWQETCAQLVIMLRKAFGRPIVLIPHVTSPHDNDFDLLKQVRDQLGIDQDDLFLIPGNLSAEETKWVISQMECLVAARTHATIAAFSSCVPTVSLAYSTKAWGINEMLFDHTEYIVDLRVSPLSQVVEKVRRSLKERNAICEHLVPKIQKMKELALHAGVKLRELLK